MTGNQHLTKVAPLSRSFIALIALSVAFAGLLVPFGAAPAFAASNTIVSLTFDDGTADQLAAAQKLQSKGMKGTFYLNSGLINEPGYLSLQQARDIQAMGHEIGSHTVSHNDLAAISLDEAKRQMCNDRVNWANWGMPVASFAYPFASVTTAVEQAAKDCGYNSARGLGDILSPKGCPPAPEWCPTDLGETIPPVDPFNMLAPDQVERTWTLADLKKSVTQAETSTRAREWVQLTFHRICTDLATCPEPGYDATIFNQFIDWLSTRPSTTVVKTIGEVIGGATKPAMPGPALVHATAIVNGNLETFNAVTGLPQCFQAASAGTNTATFTTVTTGGHGGAGTSVKIDVTGYQNGDTKLLPLLDLGECSVAVNSGQELLTLSEWYTSTSPTQFAVYYRTANSSWRYWTSSPWFSAAATWTEASWQTPLVPKDATAVSFGLNLFSNGTLTVDDFSMSRRSVSAPDAPRDISASPANGSVTVSWDAPASDGGMPITGYTVRAYRVGDNNVVETKTVSETVKTATVTGLANGTEYVFRVTASNLVGEGTAFAGTAPVTPVTIPGAPTSVKAVSANGSAALSWAPATNGGAAIVGYKVTASPGGKTCTTTGATSCTISGLSNGTRYSFSVGATNAVGAGPQSAASEVVVPGIPVRVGVAKWAYGNVLAVNVDPDRSTGSTAFRVDKMSTTGTWSPVGTYRTVGASQKQFVTLGAGVYRVVVPSAGPFGPAVSAAVRLTAPVARVGLATDSSRSQLVLNVDPDKGSGYWNVRVQKRQSNGTWSTLSGTYKTSGNAETRTINMGKGTYRVAVLGKYGYLGAYSGVVTLVK